MKPSTLQQLVIALVCFTVLSKADAQTATSGRDVNLTWTAPTKCMSGAAITACPVSGYTVQEQTGSTWTTLGSVASTTTTYKHGNVTWGQHTYRVIAESVTTHPSPPSDTAGKNVDAPGAPGGVQVVLTITVTVTP